MRLNNLSFFSFLQNAWTWIAACVYKINVVFFALEYHDFLTCFEARNILYMCKIHGTASVVIGRHWNASRYTLLKTVSSFCWLGGQLGNGLFSPAAYYIWPASFLASGVTAKCVVRDIQSGNAFSCEVNFQKTWSRPILPLAGTWLWSEDSEGSIGNERIRSDWHQ